MAVDLGDLIESLRREVNSPGGDSFPDATDDTYLGYLQDSFWEIKLDGVTDFDDYTETDGSVTNSADASGDDLTRTLQQLIVLYAGIRMIRNELKQIKTTFRAKAGPVEYETQQSAQLLKAILDELKSRRNLVLQRLSDVGTAETYYIDALVERETSLDYELTYWFTG